MLGDLNCTMDKIDRDGENKTQRLYRCCSNYALSKLIVDNGLEDLLRRPLAKDLWKQMNLGESGFSLLHRSCLY